MWIQSLALFYKHSLWSVYKSMLKSSVETNWREQNPDNVMICLVFAQIGLQYITGRAKNHLILFLYL